MVRGSGTVVEHLPHDPKVKGLSLAGAADTGLEIMFKNIEPSFIYFTLEGLSALR
jgi:hypothetical protein